MVLREVIGIEVHAREFVEDVRRGEMAAMCKDLNLGRDRRISAHVSEGCVGYGMYIRCQYIQFLDNRSVIMLIRLTRPSISLGMVRLAVYVKSPLVCQANILPQNIGRMVVESVGDERDIFDRRSIEIRDDELENFTREGLELGCALARLEVLPTRALNFEHAWDVGMVYMRHELGTRQCRVHTESRRVEVRCAGLGGLARFNCEADITKTRNQEGILDISTRELNYM